MMTTKRWSRATDRTVALLAAVLMLAGLTVTGTVSAEPADAAGLFGHERCLHGNVWREANRHDRVCVPATSPHGVARREQVKLENSLDWKRKQPNSEHCLQGFVWREANPEDRVCVTTISRSIVGEENRTASKRRALDTYSEIGFASTGGGSALVTLDLAHNGAYTLRGEVANHDTWAQDFTLVCAVPTLDRHLLAISHKVTVRGNAAGYFGGKTSKPIHVTGITAEVVNHWSAIDPNRDLTCQLGKSTSEKTIAESIQTAEKIGSGIAKVIAWF